MRGNGRDGHDFSLNHGGRVVLVTGAASGIGRGVALAFAAAGAKLILADISSESLRETADLVMAEGSTSVRAAVDVSDLQQVKEMVQLGVAEFGRLDTAVNCAGIAHRACAAHDVSEDDWDHVLAVNLTGVFWSMKCEIPEILKAGGGTIINIASRSGIIASKKLAAYSASKHGVVGLTKSAAMDYAADGLRIHAICPGPIRTPLFERNCAESPSAESAARATVPAQRIGESADVAYSSVWLASDQAAYLNGVILPVDGGSVLGHWPHP